MGFIRVLEVLFFLYFLSHIPITIFIDSQILLPGWFYPKALRDIVESYSSGLKDPTVIDPPIWYKTFCYCELFLQFPFFFVATYAFWKGNCCWIRTPSIVYSTHVATTVIPILCHLLFYNFSKDSRPGPSTLSERLTLCAIYSPYLLIPMLLLLTMLFVPHYGHSRKETQKKQKKLK